MNLLINEPPLQVLPSLAVAIGLNEAMILQQTHYWLKMSQHNRDGFKWTYKTYADWVKDFPFWSERTIRRAIKNLEEKSLLVSTDEYNKMGIDKTKWYRIDYEKLASLSTGQNDRMERTTCPDSMDKMDSQTGQNDHTNNQRILQETTTENTNNNSRKREKRIYEDTSDEMKLVDFFISEIRKNDEHFKEPNKQAWCDEFRKIIELDERDKREIAELIRWVQKNDFWKANVLSPKKLRDKYSTLVIQMKEPPKPSSGFGKRVEQVPNWFHERGQQIPSLDGPTQEDIDFEAERQKILEKLGRA